MFAFGAEKPARATPDKDLLGAAEIGDHDALMKAIEDGAWLEPNPSPGPSPGPSLTLTPALTPALTPTRREAGRRGREDAHGLALGSQVRPGRRY